MAIDLKSLNHGQLNDLIAKAEQRKRDLAKDRVVKLREKIQSMLAAEGMSLDELFPGRGRGRKGKSLGKVKPKFRNPANPSETWTGRGKRPRWLAAALTAGKKEKDFLIP